MIYFWQLINTNFKKKIFLYDDLLPKKKENE